MLAGIGLLLLGAACEQRSATTQIAPPPPGGPALRTGTMPYLLQVKDVFDVKFSYNPELDETVVVRPDGRIALEMIGEIDVVGLSPDALRQELVARYGPLLTKPDITVIVREFQPAHVYVTGQVEQPQELELAAGTTALQAITRAGGFKPDAKPTSVILLRQMGDTEYRVVKLDLGIASFDGSKPPVMARPCAATTGGCDLLNARRYEGDVFLQPMDVLVVPQSEIATVAQFFERYFNNIIPFYSNIGLSFIYDLRGNGNTFD
ncbi:MAG: polysaccharide biosynthesis/export family protein [Geminicoccaceae bacterium]